MRRKQCSSTTICSCCPTADGFLLVEFGGDTRRSDEAQAAAMIEAATDIAPAPHSPHLHPAEAARVWKVRESALGATVFVPGEPHWLGRLGRLRRSPEKLGAYLRASSR